MKLKPMIVAVAALSGVLALQGAEKIVGGPKGGRLLEVGAQKAEFFVTKERKAEIIFYDTAMKPVAPASQVVAITAEPKSGRTKVELEKTATGFVSKRALPASAEPYRVVVQLREKPEATPKNFRVALDLEECSGCKRAEYACTCDESK